MRDRNRESKIIFLTSGYEEHPAMRTDEEMKDCKVEEWPESFKGELENLELKKEAQENIRKLNDTFKKLTADPGIDENEKSMEIVNIPLSVLTGVSSWMFESAINDHNKKEYNSKFKKRVRELTITCKYNYNTVYRICSIFGFKEAKEYINTYSGEYIYGLLEFISDFSYPMGEAEEEAARATLNSIDPKLPEVFECLLDVSEYNSETLYRVFMAHGSDAEKIITYAIENELMPVQLLRYSDEKLSDGAAEALKNLKDITFQKTRKSIEGKLPRKFRKGW